MSGDMKKPQSIAATVALEALHVTWPCWALGLSLPAATGRAATLTRTDENRY
jgi:hypothetical protein